MEYENIAVVGTGALGGYYGGLLARAGKKVHFLLNSDLAHVKQHGLRVDSKHGDFHLPKVLAYGDVADMPRCQLVILSLKSTQNHLLGNLLPPLLTENGSVLVLQNGLCPEADTAAIVGEDRVLGGVCFLCSNKVGPGHIRHLDYGRIVLGEYRRADQSPPGITARVAAVIDTLREAGIDAQGAADQWWARWKKLMWNIPFNGLSVVLDASSDQLIGDMASADLARSLMQEIRAAAAACGRDIPEKHIEELLEHTRQMVPYDSSMRLDFKAGRPLEVEAIFGAPVRAAEAAGYSPRQVRMLYGQLRFLNGRLTPSGSSS